MLWIDFLLRRIHRICAALGVGETVRIGVRRARTPRLIDERLVWRRIIDGDERTGIPQHVTTWLLARRWCDEQRFRRWRLVWLRIQRLIAL